MKKKTQNFLERAIFLRSNVSSHKERKYRCSFFLKKAPDLRVYGTWSARAETWSSTLSISLTISIYYLKPKKKTERNPSEERGLEKNVVVAFFFVAGGHKARLTCKNAREERKKTQITFSLSTLV